MAAALNTFTVERRTLTYDPPMSHFAPTDLAVPFVDGVPLFKRLGEVFPGVAYDVVAPPSGHWLGEPVYVAYGYRVVLDGACSVAECCGITARVDPQSAVVVWSQLVGGDPKVMGELVFTFDREAYEQALAGLVGASPSPLVLPGG